MSGEFPPTGFHFSVAFEGLGADAADVRFQSVSGLTTTIETEPYREGGENRFAHQLPTGTTHELLELKRALPVHATALVRWCADAIEQFTFTPLNLTVTLIDENHLPLVSWQVINAFPVRWSVSEFDAQQSTVVIESLQLRYNTFRRLDA